mmetsp:Transcript_80368/g.162794  ORF Transcript_80368/g.162794 Transcript_80368/m.162794 type:complete len:235 (+) Transcript_80368:1-705(+)
MRPIDHDSVLPVVLVRDPFYWMQSMCKEGYGVRWNHDSKHHCPNLVPNGFDKKRFPKLGTNETNRSQATVPVWMGSNPTDGPSWPSLIHYWNAWYESYYYNYEDSESSPVEKGGSSPTSSSWPRLIIRFEDTLFYPKQVMAEVCHCGGGKLLSEPPSSSLSFSTTRSSYRQKHDYGLEEAKAHHKHEKKNNFVTAMIEYGTDATRLRNMTGDDVRFAVESLNTELMKAFGYSYP